MNGLAFARGRARKAGGGAAGGAAAPTTETTARTATPEGRAIVCRECAHEITRTDAAVTIAGSHTHTFMNPGGHVFEIACYRDAPGAVALGVPSSEWSWFPGSTWQVALCAACSTHIGWRFRSGESAHHGLIRDRITESDR